MAARMYLYSVILLMGVLPIGSMLIDGRLHPGAGLLLLAGKWFAFWAGGVRLLIAGLRQMLQPRYTAEVIFGLQDRAPWAIVRELGFANSALGVIGITSLWCPAWVPAAAVSAAIFYALAGINHALSPERGRLRTIAMISNLVVCAVLAASFVAR